MSTITRPYIFNGIGYRYWSSAIPKGRHDGGHKPGLFFVFGLFRIMP